MQDQIQPFAATTAPASLKLKEDCTPGTRVLIDTTHQLHSAHDTNEIVLLPPPTNHPDDPLNWSAARKYFNIAIVCFWSMLMSALGIVPNVTYGALISELDVSVLYLNTGAAVALLLYGLGNLIWNPLVR